MALLYKYFTNTLQIHSGQNLGTVVWTQILHFANRHCFMLKFRFGCTVVSLVEFMSNNDCAVRCVQLGSWWCPNKSSWPSVNDDVRFQYFPSSITIALDCKHSSIRSSHTFRESVQQGSAHKTCIHACMYVSSTRTKILNVRAISSKICQLCLALSTFWTLCYMGRWHYVELSLILTEFFFFL